MQALHVLVLILFLSSPLEANARHCRIAAAARVRIAVLICSAVSLIVVSYTERSGTVRIISARRMTSQERKAYEQ